MIIFLRVSWYQVPYEHGISFTDAWNAMNRGYGMYQSWFRKFLLSKKRVSLVYGHVASNYGDVAITEGTIQFLKKFIPVKNIHILCQTPNKLGQKALDVLLKRYPEIQYSIWDIGQIEKDLLAFVVKDEELITEAISRINLEKIGLHQSDIILFNGGEHLFSYGTREQDISMLVRLSPILAAHRAGKKIVCLPSTFGPFQSSISKSIFENFVKTCSSLSVREKNSRAYAANALGVQESDIEVNLDPAFYLHDLLKYDPSTAKDLISVSVRLDNFGLRVGSTHSKAFSTQYKESKFKDSASFQLYSGLIAFLLKNTSSTIQLVIQTLADKKLTQALYQDALDTFGENIKERVIIRKPASLFGYIKCLLEGKIIIASRFHAIIFGYTWGIPSIGIYFKEHGHKMPGLMALFEQDSYCFLASETSSEDIGKKTLELISNSKQEGKKARSLVEKLGEKYVQLFRKLLKNQRVDSVDSKNLSNSAQI